MINFQGTMATLRTAASNVKLLICRPTSEQLAPLNRFVSTVCRVCRAFTCSASKSFNIYT